MKKNFLVYQGDIHSYRFPIWSAFANQFNLYIFTDKSKYKFLSKEQLRILKNSSTLSYKGSFFKNMIFYFLTNRQDYIWLSIDTKKTLLFTILIFSKIFKTKIIIHSQGLHNLKKCNFLVAGIKKLIHFYWIFFSDLVITYSTKSNGPYRLKLFKEKIKPIRNRDANIEIFLKENKNKLKNKNDFEKKNILIIGRVRDEEFSIFLLKLSRYFTKRKYDLKLNIIGDLKEEEKEKLTNANIKCFGAIRDPKEIYKISQKCAIGFHPLATGLSATTYQVLGLIPVFHSSFEYHGPEPFDTFRETKCFLFKKNDVNSAGEALLKAYQFLINEKNFNNKLKPLCRENYSEELLNLL